MTQLLRPLALLVLSALAPGDALVFPPNPVVQHHVQAGIVRHHEHHDVAEASTATKKQHTIVAAAAATEGRGRASPAAGSSTAKERFLSNLERKRAGEDVRSSVLKADLALLSTAPTAVGRNQATDSRKPPSWRGKWEICYAPHIETLGKYILTKFGSVQYNFGNDGWMVSHAEYENAVFGSGWFNADGRVIPAPPGDGMAGDNQQGIVKVVFERFWWDRDGEAQPTGSPPGATADRAESGAVDWFVQAAGKAMFFDGLSVFPVQYLDDDLCVFQFKAAGATLVVAAQRVG